MTRAIDPTKGTLVAAVKFLELTGHGFAREILLVNLAEFVTKLFVLAQHVGIVQCARQEVADRTGDDVDGPREGLDDGRPH
jgi:hypothetical protein